MPNSYSMLSRSHVQLTTTYNKWATFFIFSILLFVNKSAMPFNGCRSKHRLS
jgi:hypothetical protein